MKKRISRFIYVADYSTILSFTLVFIFWSIWYLLAGAFSAEKLPRIFDSQREFVGMVAMLIILPSYLTASFVVSQRRSVALLGEITDKSLRGFSIASKNSPKKFLVWGTISGVSFSFFNMPGSFAEVFNADAIIISIAISQLILWSMIGGLLATRLHSALLFYQAGKQIKLDIFEMTNLKSFAQSGLSDALIILLGLTLTVLQAFDAQFRFDNYLNGIAVCLPAIIILMVTPMYSLHRRIVDSKKLEFIAVNNLIRDTSKALHHQNMTTLELLLQRRDRLKGISTWPVDLSVTSRLLLYIVIPPIAWLGAAFVEIGLDGFLGGS